MDTYSSRSPSHSRLHKALSRGRRLTQQGASEELGVSARQVRNLVEDLREEGVAVQEAFEDRQRIYYLEPGGWHSGRITLDLPERQLLTLLVATKAARPTLSPTPLVEDLDAAATSLEEALGQTVVSFIPAFEGERWHFDRSTSVDLDPSVFWPLKQAIADRHPVEVDYYSAYRDAWSRRRRIDPLLFAVRRGAWLCVAYCHKREAVLDFNLVDIEDVEVLRDAHFEPPSGFDRDQYFEGRFGALAGGETYEVRLRVSEDLTRYFERKLYHPTQQVHSGAGEEGAVVTFEVQGLDEIASFVLSWGAGVEVLRPERLRERIGDEVSAMTEMYA